MSGRKSAGCAEKSMENFNTTAQSHQGASRIHYGLARSTLHYFAPKNLPQMNNNCFCCTLNPNNIWRCLRANLRASVAKQSVLLRA